jgi:peptide subunit release factor 1 (eRF1)/transcriptional regulator with XRE-family HTH domain
MAERKKFDSVTQYRIRKLLSELADKTGRGTELVTLYLPPKKPVHEAIAALREESGTASNIKSDTTRAHVQDALTKVMQRLRLYKQTPENGLVIFCGAIPGPGGPGNEIIELYEVLPNKPVTTYLYRCDDHFHLDPLREMLREENIIGLLALDATEAGLGIVSGDNWEVVDTTSSGVSGKTRKGGQCVSADTLIQLRDGRLEPISRLSPDATIVSYDFGKPASGFYKVVDTFSFVPKNYYLVETAGPKQVIRATEEHRFFSLDSKGIVTKHARDLHPGDRVLVSRKLPEPEVPESRTLFPTKFSHTLDSEGRDRLKAERLRRKLTQAGVAKILSLHRSDVYHVESGEAALSWDKLTSLIRFLIKDPDQFISDHIIQEQILPAHFSSEMLQLLGYILGQGRASTGKIELYFHHREVTELYASFAKKALNLAFTQINSTDLPSAHNQSSKRTHLETIISLKEFADSLKQCYPGLLSTKLRDIPEQIHRLSNPDLAFFIKGMFDAEGHASRRGISFATKSPDVIKKLQLLLLRFGIVSSYRIFNKLGNQMHGLDISDHLSIGLFREHIGFSASYKRESLCRLLETKEARDHLSCATRSSWAVEGARQPVMTADKTAISEKEFSQVVDPFGNELSLETTSNGNSRTSIMQQSVSTVSMILSGELISARVSKISKIENTKRENFVDIELPETGSFIGNGFVLHNSARRYERLREMELTEYYTRLADHAKKVFLEQYVVKGLIVSGPGPTKDEFVKDRYLDYRLQDRIIGVLDTGYAGREGVRETFDKAGKLLENVRVVEERKLVQRFLREINSDTGLAIYGINDILAALKKAAVDTVLINDDTDILVLRSKCLKCDNLREKFVQRSTIVSERQNLLGSPCPKCSSLDMDITQKDIVDYFVDATIDSGAKVEVISSRTEDGAMLKSFGGVAALLRYRS